MTHDIHNLVAILTERLNELAQSPADHDQVVHLHVQGTEVRCQLEQIDRLACQVSSISTTSPTYERCSTEQLEVYANILAQRLTYLEEQLVVQEVDARAAEVQLRSTAPRREHDVRTYFEMRVGRHGILLQRFLKKDKNAREVIPATLTREVLGRVCVDLVQSEWDELPHRAAEASSAGGYRG